MYTNFELGKLWDTEMDLAFGISGAWTASEGPQEVRINIKTSNTVSSRVRLIS